MDISFPVHFAHLFCIYTGRLIHHDVYAALHAFDSISDMIIVSCGNYAGVYMSALKHFLCIVEILNAISVALFFRPFKAFTICIGYCDKFGFGTLPGFYVVCMTGSHIPDSDYSEFYLFHYLKPLDFRYS